MRVLEENVNLVIAGAWNPAILMPNWIAEKAMHGAAGENFQVQVELPVMSLGLNSQRPRFAFRGISVLSDPTALTFKLAYDDKAQIDLSISTAANILELLSHTPVSGVGFNFGFEFADPSPDLLATFAGTSFLPDAATDPDAALVKQDWSGVIKDGIRLINVSASLEAGIVIFDINVHTEVRSAQAAVDALRVENLFAEIKDEVISLINRFIPMEVAAK